MPVTLNAPGSRRLLVECKDFDMSCDGAGLDINRNFASVADDIAPNKNRCDRITLFKWMGSFRIQATRATFLAFKGQQALVGV